MSSELVEKTSELQMKTLQIAPKDAEGCMYLVKEREKEEAMHIEDIQRLVTEEIEMLCVVLSLVKESKRRQD
jgi:hypothetical protein